MGRLLPFLICLFHCQVAILASLTTSTKRHLCSSESSLLLLQFKQTINIDNTASLGCESNGKPSFPKTISWNRLTDCCVWNGVTCDELTGEVIGLDLSCSQLQGVINSNSTLFQLSHLQSLNLAYNDFSSSLIPRNFSGLQSLTHLNLSNSEFSGPLPLEFSFLFNLISLDLSLSDEIVIQPGIFKFLLQNSTRLREVLLTGTNISSVLPHNLSHSLTILNLGSTNLYGNLPLEIFSLPNLQTLQLYDNIYLTGQLSNVKWNASSALRYLDMSGTDFSGELPDSIGYLSSLNHLELSSCKFFGSIPDSLGNVTQMVFLGLSSNNFRGQLPSGLANLQHLIHLDLSSNSFEGHFPNSIGNFITTLMLSDNFFVGNFPSTIINATQLESLDLSNNLFTGSLPSNVSGFPNLVLLFLNDNSFNSRIPSWVFSLPSLTYLNFQSNQLTGELYEFQHQSLQRIYLSGNNLRGPIPKSISKLVNLTHLDLSSNFFSRIVDVSMFSNLKLLEQLNLSNNSLVLTRDGVNSTLPESLHFLYLSSCGLRDLDSLTGASNLARLDVSHNMLRGELLFSEQKWHRWAETLIYLDVSHNFLMQMDQVVPFKNLFFLDLRHNSLQGSMLVPPITTRLFFASNNNFTGEIPPSVCEFSSLMVLDFSENNLSGVIPQCWVNTNKDLSVLDLHNNRFYGKMPTTFAVGSSLRTLNLRNNQLEGTLPRSLSKCIELEVLDIGNNNLNDTFPAWLGTLPKLKVLSLRANNFHGPVNLKFSSRDPLSFSSLRILDLSNNAFTGVLPNITFAALRRTGNDETDQKLTYIGDQIYEDSAVLIIKGLEMNFVRILSIFTTMDLSINNFEGRIPDDIGDLTLLRGLNLSHNNLAGPIPRALGNLKVLESMDLSSNQLEGQIPRQLATLPYLSFFNVSHNHLEGSIPRGQQFNTFQNNSYIGNSGLCGFPLSKGCGADGLPPFPTPAGVQGDYNEEIFNGFTWKSVLIGFGCGWVIGASIGCFIFITGKPEWFNKIIQQECSRLEKKKWPKEIKWL